MKQFPVTYGSLVVGSVYLTEEIVLTLETLMKQKFGSLDCQPFILNATFQSNSDTKEMIMLSINILEKEES